MLSCEHQQPRQHKDNGKIREIRKLQPGYNKNGSVCMVMKKGIFFTMDAILAAGIIILTILLASKYYIQEDQSSTGYFLSSDAVRIFSDIRVSELESAYAAQLIQSGDIEDANSTVLEQIGRFWSDGKEDLAENFSRNMTDGIIPKEFGVGIYVDGEEIYSRGTPVNRSLVSSRKIISGVTKAKPKDGYTTKVILNGIDSKTTSTYSYFGGFEGNGNITKKLILPNNVNSIINISLELDAGSDFSLYANGAFSGTYVKGSAGGGEMKADKFFIDRAYFGNFANGTNVFSINFTGEDKYVAGGFLRVKYSTSDMNDTFNPRGAVYWLPGINGIINVFSSVYSPSDITNIEAYLEFYSNYTTFLKLGKTLVYNNKTNGSTSAYISNQTFSSAIAAEGLSYSGISRKTLPLRVGLNFTKVITGGNADVILITDVSGSMNWRLDNSNTGTTRTCEDPNLYSPSTKRISLAKCLDKQFIDILLNSSLGNTTNRVGLVAYSGLPSSFGSSNVDTIVSTHDLSYDNVSLKNQIDGYNPNGATGVCGAIRQARTILEQQGNSTRRKFIVVMTDGLANVQCDETSQYESTGCIAQQCPNSNFCFSGGQPGCLYQQCGDWVNNASSQNAVNDACMAFNTTNATVFSVGFGPVGSCPIGNDTLVSIADCGRGESFSSTNATQLSTIYSKIAQSILEASFSAQSIEIPGDVNTILSPNSYIMVNFSSLSTLTFAKIPLTFETDRFGNNITTGSFTIPAGTGAIDAKITSYS